ncbi:MAG: hypothetical protein LUP94_02120 [Candidatus Methanomethylicus sp.]|nr:hypothetical protein [Candidatus Methanomethylicus sp.]
MRSISYADLLTLWKKGSRNGSLQRLSCLKKGLFSAALSYAKLGKNIVNSKLVLFIEDIADLIKNSLRRRIMNCGSERAIRIVQNPKIVDTAPEVRQWVKCDAFVFWLGTSVLTKKSWILVQ